MIGFNKQQFATTITIALRPVNVPAHVFRQLSSSYVSKYRSLCFVINVGVLFCRNNYHFSPAKILYPAILCSLGFRMPGNFLSAVQITSLLNRELP